jgi:hypothetical protein
MAAGGRSAKYHAAVQSATADCWLSMRPSGAYLIFTQVGADRFGAFISGYPRTDSANDPPGSSNREKARQPSGHRAVWEETPNVGLGRRRDKK